MRLLMPSGTKRRRCSRSFEKATSHAEPEARARLFMKISRTNVPSGRSWRQAETPQRVRVGDFVVPATATTAREGAVLPHGRSALYHPSPRETIEVEFYSNRVEAWGRAVVLNNPDASTLVIRRTQDKFATNTDASLRNRTDAWNRSPRIQSRPRH